MKKKRGCFKTILILFGILLLLGFCSSILNNDDKLADTPIPAPTEKPLTPTPTTKRITPTRVVSSSSDDSAEEMDEYSTELFIESMMCSTSLDAMSKKFLLLGDNTNLMFDDYYMEGVYSAIDDFEAFCTNFYDENAPEEYSELNDILLQIDVNYSLSIFNLRNGLKNYDMDNLNLAADYLNIGTEYLVEATEWLEKRN